METLKTFFEGITETNSGTNIIHTTFAVLAAAVVGLIIYFTYKLTCKAFTYDDEMGIALILVPVVVALLLSVIGTNIARAFSLAGALSIVRYRSVLISPRNLALIFFGMGAGFISGVGLYIPALIFVVITCIIIIIYSSATAGNKENTSRKTLRVCIPENINYDGLLDETLKKYTSDYALASVGTVSGGTVTELVYNVRLKNESDAKAMLDDIKVLNGNFRIQLSQFIPMLPQ